MADWQAYRVTFGGICEPYEVCLSESKLPMMFPFLAGGQ